MKTKILLYIIILLIFSIFVSGCADNNNKIKYIYGNATIENIDIQIPESFPVEINVIVRGYLQDVCTDFDKIEIKREDKVFFINIKTIKSIDAICEDQPYYFERVIPLEAQNVSPGVYNIIVNNINGSFVINEDSSSSK